MKKVWSLGLVLSIYCCLLSGCGSYGVSGDSMMKESESVQEPSNSQIHSSEVETTESVFTEVETSETEEQDVVTELETETVPPEPVVETLTITATGDCALGALQYHGYARSFHQYYDKYGETYFFQNFYDIFSQDDITIVNLECVFTDETKRVEKTYNIKGHPHYAGILSSSSVEVCSLANNHTEDYGPASFTDTKEALDAAQVAYAYEDVVAYYETESGIKVAMLSAYLLSKKAVKEPILMAALEVAKQEADLVIVSCHWGTENTHKLTSYQINTAHKLIDAGADLVIGHHPHVLQGVEYYQGKMICYSLGNFSFGANRNPADKNTAVFQQTFTFVDGQLTDVLDAKIIPTRLSGQDDSNNYQPVIATGAKAQKILQNMREYSASLSEISIDEEGNISIN